MQLVVQPCVLPLPSTLLVNDYALMLSVIPKVGLIAIRTLVLLQRLSYLLTMPVCLTGKQSHADYALGVDSYSFDVQATKELEYLYSSLQILQR